MEIKPNEVHLWVARDEEFRDSALLEGYRTQLNEAESEQQRRFHFDRHRHQYLITRALVRNVLSLYVSDIAPSEWRFDKNKYGKPSICKDFSIIPLRFNLSHTEGMIVLAITLEYEVGVDVEYLLRKGQTTQIADRYFSAIETEQLLSLPVDHQRERFFDLWTLKEAYIKACGMGLSIPLEHFTFQFSVDKGIDISFSPKRQDKPEDWLFWQLEPNTTHKISLALNTAGQAGIPHLACYEFTPAQDARKLSPDISRRSR